MASTDIELSTTDTGNDTRTVTSTKQRGFSLIELLIVVAIIVIIVTMAIPSFTTYMRNTNEVSAANSLKQIRDAEAQYQTIFPAKGFADNLGALGNGGMANGTSCAPSPEHACLIENTLSTGVKQGYKFVAQGGSPVNGINQTFAVGAAPLSYNHSGARMFCITSEDSQIRVDANLGGSTTPPSGTVCLSGQFSPM